MRAAACPRMTRGAKDHRRQRRAVSDQERERRVSRAARVQQPAAHSEPPRPWGHVVELTRQPAPIDLLGRGQRQEVVLTQPEIGDVRVARVLPCWEIPAGYMTAVAGEYYYVRPWLVLARRPVPPPGAKVRAVVIAVNEGWAPDPRWALVSWRTRSGTSWLWLAWGEYSARAAPMLHLPRRLDWPRALAGMTPLSLRRLRTLPPDLRELCGAPDGTDATFYVGPDTQHLWLIGRQRGRLAANDLGLRVQPAGSTWRPGRKNA